MREANEPEDLRLPCDVYARIVGYMRPVSAWNQGKQQEFEERVTFAINASDDASAAKCAALPAAASADEEGHNAIRNM